MPLGSAMNRPGTRVEYFEEEGKINLQRVVAVIRRTMKKRDDLRTVVFFTAFGEGPAMAYKQLQAYEPKIVAVTFPLTFFVSQGDKRFNPTIPPRLRQFFEGVKIPILTGRLVWDHMVGCDAHNQNVELIKRCLSVFGGSMPLCIQAVLQACDMGQIEVGERVIAATGDCAAVVTATASQLVFSKEFGLAVNELLCKARNPTMLYAWAQTQKAERDQGVLELKPAEHNNG